METKTCTLCHEPKPVDRFSIDNQRRDGLRSQCKACVSCDEDRKAYMRAYAAIWRRTVQYGITVTDWERMLREQHNACAVCLAPFGASHLIHVDHNHACCPGKRSCGKCVRGFLCPWCNKRLGTLEDMAFVQAAMVYLERGSVGVR